MMFWLKKRISDCKEESGGDGLPFLYKKTPIGHALHRDIGASGLFLICSFKRFSFCSFLGFYVTIIDSNESRKITS